MENKKRFSGGSSVVKGTAIIGIAGILVKILGAVFRIPLTNWAGDLGMSYYQVAYNIYNALVVMALAGFPVAISKLVSENLARGHYGNAHKVFQIAIKLMAVIGGLSAGICFFGAEYFAEKVNNPLAATSLKAIAPALIFVPIVASFRGYFQGRNNMKPTALSEIVEQSVRVFVGLTLARVFVKTDLVKAMSGATFGATVGSFTACLLMVGIYFLFKPTVKKQIARDDGYYEDSLSILKKILVIAVPIIIGAEIIPIMYSIDMGIIMNRLEGTGWTDIEARSMYGLMSAYCNTLINMPEFLIHAIAVSMVPSIAHSAAKGNKEDVSASINTGYRLTTTIAFPCMVGIFALAKPILLLLYRSQPEQAASATNILMVMSLTIVVLALYETSTGTLQAVGKQYIPVINVAIGAVVKIILTYVLVGIHSINILGGAISSIFAFFIPFLLNEIAVRKYTGVRTDIVKTYVKPGVASLVMGVCAFLSHKLFSMVVGSSIATCLAILVGVAVYVIMVVVIKVIEPSEVAVIPGGNKINRILSRVPGWR